MRAARRVQVVRAAVAAGRPHWDSKAIGLANRHLAPATDFTGRRRDAEPDAGAYEWRD